MFSLCIRIILCKGRFPVYGIVIILKLKHRIPSPLPFLSLSLSLLQYILIFFLFVLSLSLLPSLSLFLSCSECEYAKGEMRMHSSRCNAVAWNYVKQLAKAQQILVITSYDDSRKRREINI